MRLFITVLTFVLSTLGCGGTSRSGETSGLLAEGQPAPNLKAEDHNGQVVSVLEGGPLVIYFYPRDATPGCTTEACAFRDTWARYQDAGVRVVGVSSDSVESHRAFAKEHELPFSLISDDKRLWAKAFGVSSFLGMTKRVSFLINAEGKILKVYPDVDPGVHATEVLADARTLGLTRR